MIWDASETLFWYLRTTFLSVWDGCGSPFWYLWAHFWGPGGTLGGTLGHTWDQSSKNSKKITFLDPPFGTYLGHMSTLLRGRFCICFLSLSLYTSVSQKPPTNPDFRAFWRHVSQMSNKIWKCENNAPVWARASKSHFIGYAI